MFGHSTKHTGPAREKRPATYSPKDTAARPVTRNLTDRDFDPRGSGCGYAALRSSWFHLLLSLTGNGRSFRMCSVASMVRKAASSIHAHSEAPASVCNFSIRNEPHLCDGQRLADHRRLQREQLPFPALLQPRPSAAQLIGAVSGMAHELRRPLRQVPYERRQFLAVVLPGNPKPRKMIGHPASVSCEHPLESPPQKPEGIARGATGPPHARSSDGKVERTPHPRYAKFLRQTRHRIQNRRQQVRMLVRIQMTG